MKCYKTDLDNRVIFSPEMQVAELIEADYSLLSVFVRMDMQLPFGDRSVEELCAKYDISAELFLIICQLYSMSDYVPCTEQLTPRDLKLLVKYLRASHKFYAETLLPSIGQGVDAVLGRCSERERAIVKRFYGDYFDEVSAHLEYEEQHLFPYVERLAEGGDVTQVGVVDLMDDHTDICDKIGDIKSILIKYLPEECSTRERYDLLCDVFRLCEELEKHTLVEVRILMPVVAEMERRLGNA